MKKLFLVGLLLSALVAGAKGRVTVKIAEGSENPEIESLLGLLDASQAVATIVADSIDAPLYAVWMVNYSGDEPTRKLAGMCLFSLTLPAFLLQRWLRIRLPCRSMSATARARG